MKRKENYIKETSLIYHAYDIRKGLCSDQFFHYLMERYDDVRLLFCQSLIDSVLINSELKNTEYFHSQQHGKRMILDMVAQDEQGHLYNIEMQVGNIDESNFIRFQCYGSKLLESQENQGEDYVSIKDVYQLIISEHGIKGLDDYQCDFVMYDALHEKPMPYHKIHTRIIQLSRIEEREIKEDMDEVMYLYAKGKAYRKGNKEVEEIMDAYLKFANSEEFWSEYTKYSNEMLYRSKIVLAKRDGEKEGEERGKREGIDIGKKELVKTMIEAKYHSTVTWLEGCSLDQLDEIAKLLLQDISIEELEKLVKEN